MTKEQIKQIVKNSAGGLVQQLLDVPAGGKSVTVQSGGRLVTLHATMAETRSATATPLIGKAVVRRTRMTFQEALRQLKDGFGYTRAPFLDPYYVTGKSDASQ